MHGLLFDCACTTDSPHNAGCMGNRCGLRGQYSYGSENFIDSHSMRKTRLLQRRPDTYRLIDFPIEATPLYKRYFPEKEEK